jgi:hypothetical protein
MPCPVCSHTLDGISHGMFHCPRCGTLVNCPAVGDVCVPALVRRCDDFARRLSPDRDALLLQRWHSLGIAESIATEHEREGD